jgi:hypothetical protein
MGESERRGLSCADPRRSGRVAEGGALLRRYGGECLHRGFESLLLRSCVDFEPGVPERRVHVSRGSTPCRHRRGDEREAERRGVGEQVAGVGEQGERVSDHARDDLGGHQADDEDEGDRQCAAVGRQPVIVIVVRPERLVTRPTVLEPLRKEAAEAAATRAAREVVPAEVRVRAVTAHAVKALFRPHT